MAGNEIAVCRFLLANLKRLSLKHIGKIEKISDPRFGILEKPEDADQVATQSSNKKADIFINNIGVSIKQKGSSFSFNRLQRANIY
ncbi:MAG: hypothetical protein ABIG42_04130, partial [bacterium]